MKPFCDTVSCFSCSKYCKLCMVKNPLVQHKGLISTLDKNSIKLSTLKDLTTIEALQKNEYAEQEQTYAAPPTSGEQTLAALLTSGRQT